jgi:MFS family permease
LRAAAEAYGFMTAAMGIGAVIGGLFTAARGRTGLRPMIFASVGFGVAILVCAFSPVLGLAYAALLFVGWASVSSIAIGNSTIQLSSELSMRGRVLALWQVAFQGTTPVGGPVIGWIIALTDPRIGLAVGGASCFAAAIAGAGLARRYRRTEALKAVQLESPASAGPLAARKGSAEGAPSVVMPVPSGATASCAAVPPQNPYASLYAAAGRRGWQ